MSKWNEQAALVLSKLEEFTEQAIRNEDRNDKRFEKLETKIDTVIAAQAVGAVNHAALKATVTMWSTVTSIVVSGSIALADLIYRIFSAHK